MVTVDSVAGPNRQPRRQQMKRKNIPQTFRNKVIAFTGTYPGVGKSYIKNLVPLFCKSALLCRQYKMMCTVHTFAHTCETSLI